MSCCPTCGTVLGAGDPSPAEARALAAICDFHDRMGRFPTYRELAIQLRYSSWRGAPPIVRGLARKGWVKLSGVQGKTAIQAARRAT